MANLVNQKYLERFVIEKEPPEYNFIADSILTRVDVKQTSGKFVIFDKFSSKLVETRVGIKSPATQYSVLRGKTEGTFATTERALKDLVTDKEADAYSDFTDLVEDAILGLKKLLKIEKEYDIANNLVNANLTSDNSFTPSTKWDGANPTIEKDIRTAIAEFEKIAGITPNTLIIPKQVWDKIVMDATLRDIWKLVPTIAKDIKLSSLLKLLFDNFDEVLIPNAEYDASAKGRAESLTPIWPDNVVLLYVHKGKATPRTFTYAARFVYQDWKVKQIPEQDPEGIWVRVWYDEDRKEVCPNAKYVITNVLT